VNLRFFSVALLCLVALPAAAGTRVTLQLEDATLHEALTAVSRTSGCNLMGSGGEGTPRFQAAVPGKRMSPSWKNAPLGKVLRDLCAAYDVSVTPRSDTVFWFQPSVAKPAQRTEAGEMSVALSFLEQSEQLRAVPGHATAPPERLLQLGLSLRAENGDADNLGPLTELTLVHADGRRQSALSAPFEGRMGLPDELGYAPISAPQLQASPAKLKALEGKVILYDGLNERRFAHDAPASGSAETFWEETQGPLTVRVSRFKMDGRSVEMRVRLEWPHDAPFMLHDGRPLRVAMRQDGDRVAWLYASPIREGGKAGGHTADLECRGYLQAAPKSIELYVTTRAPQTRLASFRMTDITLPFGQALPLRTVPQNLKVPDLPGPSSDVNAPAPFRDPQGGSLRLDLQVPSQAGTADDSVEISVGLRRQTGPDAWSSVYWTELTADESDGFTVRGLAAGTYRLTARVTRRKGGVLTPIGSVQKPLTVRVIAGKATELTLPLGG
jgi:hypothetical protein